MKEISIVLCLWALSSCAPKTASTEPKTLNASIINGVKVKETDALATSVVGVMNVRSNFICSGTLIAPNVVLTAAHCAPERASHVKIIFGLDVDNIMNSLEPDIKDAYMLTATDFKTGPTWDPKDEVKEIDTGDIALVSFKGVVPANFKPAKFLTDSNLLKIGNTVTVAGFGVDDVDTSKQINPKKYRDLEEAIANGEVVCDDEANGDHIKCYKVEMSGDGVLRTTKAPIQFIHETEVRLNEQKAGTCSGDSGGPAFMEVNGELLLWGVTSRGSGLCNEVGVYTNALYYKKWIDETIPALK